MPDPRPDTEQERPAGGRWRAALRPSRGQLIVAVVLALVAFGVTDHSRGITVTWASRAVRSVVTMRR